MSEFQLALRRDRIRPSRRHLPLSWEALEERRLLSYSVNDSGDAPLDASKGPAKTSEGTITLRSAIQQVDIDGGGEIDFSVSTVNAAPLPDLTVPATVNGGSKGAVTINGSGLTFTAGNSVAEYLVISGASDNGIRMTGGGGNKVVGNWVHGSDQWGVVLDEAPSSTVGGTTATDRNVISGNSAGGVAIVGGSSTGDLVEGNYIGTDMSGSSAQGNGYSGVYVGSGTPFTNFPPGSASNATIGGTSAGARNIISGNDTANTGNGGIVVYGTGASNNLIEGNFVGVNTGGTTAVPNIGVGIHLFNGATNNTVGGTTAGAANVVSGNQGDGIEVTDSGTSRNVVEGNDVGVDASSTTAIANTGLGISVSSASNNTIGGTTPAAANVVSGNNVFGILITGNGATSNLIAANRVGTDRSGTIALGNGSIGVDLSSGAANNTVGGMSDGAVNIISGNKSSGLDISGSGTTGNLVIGNHIGTDATGTLPIPNANQGVLINGGAASNTIGGSASSAANLVSGNMQGGIDIDGSGTSQNLVIGNLIGTDLSGSKAVPNVGEGLGIGDNASNNTIGGTSQALANILSGNGSDGVILGSNATANLVEGNWIGVNQGGTKAIANSGDGIGVSGASNNTIGGTSSSAANVISGNQQSGISAHGSGTDDNLIAGNMIGTDITGTAAIANSWYGVNISDNSEGNTLGGTATGARNVISGNMNQGVVISDSGTSENLVAGNLIGTDVSGTNSLGNGQQGVLIGGGATSNTIGGSSTGAQISSRRISPTALTYRTVEPIRT